MTKRRWLKTGLACCSVLLLASGCRSLFGSAPKAVIYTQDKPGPWKDVMPAAPSVTVDGLKVTIKVDYRSRVDDYVDRISVVDDQGRDVGMLAFGAGGAPEVTFILPRGTRTVTVLIRSTKNGVWSSKPVPVPEPPAEKEK